MTDRMSDEEFERIIDYAKGGRADDIAFHYPEFLAELKRAREVEHILDLENMGLKLGKMACEDENAELKRQRNILNNKNDELVDTIREINEGRAGAET